MAGKMKLSSDLAWCLQVLTGQVLLFSAYASDFTNQGGQAPASGDQLTMLLRKGLAPRSVYPGYTRHRNTSIFKNERGSEREGDSHR